MSPRRSSSGRGEAVQADERQFRPRRGSLGPRRGSSGRGEAVQVRGGADQVRGEIDGAEVEWIESEMRFWLFFEIPSRSDSNEIDRIGAEVD